MTTDAEAESFLDQDLSGLDFRQFQPARFEFARKDATVNMRMPAALLEAIKAQAAARGVPYQRWMREALEREVRETMTAAKARLGKSPTLAGIKRKV